MTSVRKLTGADLPIAKSWLHDFFVASDMLSDMKEATTEESLPQVVEKDSTVQDAVNLIKNALEKRLPVVIGIDEALKEIADNTRVTVSGKSTETTKVAVEDIASYLGWFCAEAELYWNDTDWMSEEKANFIETLLGEALALNKCFISDIPEDSVDSEKVVPDKTSAKEKSATVKDGVKKLPKDDYKSTGAHSKDARDLISGVGDKAHLPLDKSKGNFIFAIQGKVKKGGTIEAAYIRPLEDKGAEGSTNKVFFGTSWKNYRHCICYFNTYEDAVDFMSKMIALGIISSDTAEIGKLVPATNGYFLIGTSCGKTYIKASELNEAIEESKVEDLSESAKKREINKSEKFRGVDDSGRYSISGATTLEQFERDFRHYNN